MKSRWRQIQPLESGRDYTVLASRIPARRLSSTARLFRGSRAVTAQLAQTDGVVGFSLLARPLHKEYATLSVWVDETSLRSFVSSTPHARLMTDLAHEMSPTRFVRWTIDGSTGRPRWEDALARLAAPE